MSTRKPTAAQMELLQAWRAEALMRMPYMASILFSVTPLDAPGIGTFAVDKGHRLYIDFEAVVEWGPQACGQALLHECGHLLADHARFAAELGIGPQTHMIWNLSGDAALNDDLAAAGCDYIANTGILPAKLKLKDWQTAQYYYNELAKMMPPQKQQGQGGGQGDPQDSDDQNQGQGSGGQDGQQDGSEGGKPNDKFSGCGSGSGGEKGDFELPDNDPNAPALSESQRELVRIRTAAHIQQAKSRGKVPGGFVELADQILTPPPTPWRQVLASAIRRVVASRMGNYDMDYARRSRRHHNQQLIDQMGVSKGRMIWPGTYEPEPKIAVIRDTSGSMQASDLAIVVGEIEQIAKQLGIRGDALTVTDVDAEVYDTRRWNGAKSIEDVQGRGGTDMRVGIEHIQELAPSKRPHAIIVVTDGGTPWPDEPGTIPVVACVIGKEGEQWIVTPPAWMKVVWIDPAECGVAA